MQSSKLLSFSFLRIMATVRNKRKLAAVSRDTQESARKGQSQNTFVPGLTEEYITQGSEEVEGRVTKRLSQDFSRTESRILGALSKLDEFLLKPQVRICSGTVPGTSRKNDSENREPEWSLSRSGVLCSSGQHFSWLRPEGDISQLSSPFLIQFGKTDTSEINWRYYFFSDDWYNSELFGVFCRTTGYITVKVKNLT